MEVARKAAVVLHLAGVVVRRHVAAAIPALISQTEYGQLPGLRMAVGSALLRQRGGQRAGHVLQPVCGLLRRPGTDVDGNERRGTDLANEVHVFVRAESVRLGHSAPVGIQGNRALRTDAIAPMVVVSEAAARPTHVGHLDRSQCCDHIITDAPSVGNRRTGPHPDALVYAMSQVLCELAKNVTTDRRPGFGCIEGDRHHIRCLGVLRRGTRRFGVRSPGARTQCQHQRARCNETQTTHSPSRFFLYYSARLSS